MDQIELEKEMADLGRRRYRKLLQSAREQKRESSTKGVQRILRHAIGYYEQALEEWMEGAVERSGPRHRIVTYLQKLPLQMVAALSARAIMDAIGAGVRMTRMANRVSNALEDELFYRAFDAQDRKEFRHWKRKARGTYNSYEQQRRMMRVQGLRHDVAFEAWPHAVKVQVGVVCIETFARSTGLVKVQQARIRNKTYSEVVATEEGIRAVEQAHLDAEELSPVYLPCIEPPRPWVSPMVGGYLSANLYKRALVKTEDRAYLEELSSSDLSDVLEAVNALQGTAYAVNERVLEVMQHAWEHDIHLPGMPERDNLPLPPKPDDIDTNEEARREWKKRARAVHERNDKTRSARLRIAKILHQARRFVGQSLYYVQQLDFRGRCYSNGYFLQPQGEDKCKALLQFSEGKPINTEEAIAFYFIHGANCWGHDKLSYDDRLKWVHDNAELIVAIAEDPWEQRDWQEADEPWQFLAWCFDFAEWAKDPEGYASSLPVAMDATQSGIQILSTLLRDERGARATNCVPSEEPQDLYQQVADETVELLKKDLGSPYDDIARYWLRFGITRSACKRPTMTRVYNATIYSCREYLYQWFNEELKARGDVTWETLPEGYEFITATVYLAGKVWRAMDHVITGTKVVMGWLGEISQTFAAAHLPIRWTTPIGWTVKQDYKKWKNRDVKTKLGYVVRYHKIRLATEKVDARRSKQAFAPNFIHSLDGAVMMLTVLQAKAVGVTHFCMVHDSFATHAHDAHLLYASLREAYSSMFSDDLLSDLRDQLLAQLPEGTTLPPVPEQGTFDPAVIRESKYFFC